MPANEESEDQHSGDFRLADNGELEIFDGTTWVSYRSEPDIDPGPILRDEPPSSRR
ncbi:hypothetical protein [Micromonospora sp. DT62]|uniref:hypothetical protein n=1 Tax=Micromonospora sp. DT62 TaxID=3416521 RepID=UPI003CEECE50